MAPLPPFTQFDGRLNVRGMNSFLALVNGTWYLMMLDIPPTGTFSAGGVLAATNHFYGTANGSAISVRGFVQQDDVDGTGNVQSVLHVVQDLTP
jgi:hypothetical protein